VFCMTAITWGWDIADTAERLMEESTKTQANGASNAKAADCVRHNVLEFARVMPEVIVGDALVSEVK
jgi:hypothetical protein